MDITHNPLDPRHVPDSYGGVHRLRTDSPEDGVRCGRIVPNAPPGVFAVGDAARVTCSDCRATLADSEQPPENGPFSRPALLRVAREELAASEAHLTLARQIKADGNGAHSVPYWELEVAMRQAQIKRLEPRPAYWCKKCRKEVNGTIRADSEPPHFERHYLTSGPDRGMACGPVVRMCGQCGAAGAVTVTDAGDFCACGAEVPA